MTFFPPISFIRKGMILKKLKMSKALSFETSKTLTEVGIVNPNKVKKITDILVRTGKINRTLDGKYYINDKY